MSLYYISLGVLLSDLTAPFSGAGKPSAVGGFRNHLPWRTFCGLVVVAFWRAVLCYLWLIMIFFYCETTFYFETGSSCSFSIRFSTCCHHTIQSFHIGLM